DVLDVDADVVSLVTHDRAEEHGAETWNRHTAVDMEMRRAGLDEHKFSYRAPHRWASPEVSWRRFAETVSPAPVGVKRCSVAASPWASAPDVGADEPFVPRM